MSAAAAASAAPAPDVLLFYDWRPTDRDQSKKLLANYKSSVRHVVYWPHSAVTRAAVIAAITAEHDMPAAALNIFVYDHLLAAIDSKHDDEDEVLLPSSPLLTPWSILTAAQSPLLWMRDEEVNGHSSERVMVILRLAMAMTAVSPPPIIRMSIQRTPQYVVTRSFFHRGEGEGSSSASFEKAANMTLRRLLASSTPPELTSDPRAADYKAAIRGNDDDNDGDDGTPAPFDMSWRLVPPEEGLVLIREDAVDVLETFLRDTMAAVAAKRRSQRQPQALSATSYVVQNKDLPWPSVCRRWARTAIWEWYHRLVDWTYPALRLPATMPAGMLDGLRKSSVLDDVRGKLAATTGKLPRPTSDDGEITSLPVPSFSSSTV